MTPHGMHGWEAVAEFLDRQHAPFRLIEHAETFSAGAEAGAAGIEPERVAKTVVLHDHDGFRLAIIPASERLDIKRAREVLGASSRLRLATEEEIGREFPVFETGALPPFSSLLAMPEILDRRLLQHETVVCSGGDHRHSMIVSPREIQRLGEPLVGDVCRHEMFGRHDL